MAAHSSHVAGIPCGNDAQIRRKKLWSVFFERPEGPVQKLKQFAAKE